MLLCDFFFQLKMLDTSEEETNINQSLLYIYKQLSINQYRQGTEALIDESAADVKTYSHRSQCNFEKWDFKNMCSKITDNLIQVKNKTNYEPISLYTGKHYDWKKFKSQVSWNMEIIKYYWICIVINAQQTPNHVIWTWFSSRAGNEESDQPTVVTRTRKLGKLAKKPHDITTRSSDQTSTLRGANVSGLGTPQCW